MYKSQHLRFKNEPVRHKTLDLIGDLALLGKPIKGHVTAIKSGHKGNVEFARILREEFKDNLNERYKLHFRNDSTSLSFFTC